VQGEVCERERKPPLSSMRSMWAINPRDVFYAVSRGLVSLITDYPEILQAYLLQFLLQSHLKRPSNQRGAHLRTYLLPASLRSLKTNPTCGGRFSPTDLVPSIPKSFPPLLRKGLRRKESVV
jgi:hypothetical protein